MTGCGRGGAKTPASAAGTQPVAQTTQISEEKIQASLIAAEEYLRSDDAMKAQAILLKLVERVPTDARAHEMLGQTLTLMALQADRKGDARSGDIRRSAYEQYRIAVDLKPGSAGLQQSAGQIALEAGETDAALHHFHEAGRLDPTNPQYPLYEAQPLIKLARYDEAKAALNRVLALDPDEAIAHASLAMIELELKNYDQALRHMAEARRIQPNDIGLRAQEAKIHRRMGDPKVGLQLLLSLGPSDRAQEVVAVEIASCYEQIGEPINAARAWQQCYQAKPTDSRAYLWAVRAAESLLKAGEREQATLWLQQAQLAAPQAPEVKALEDAVARLPAPAG